jgi:hypothetical protein
VISGLGRACSPSKVGVNCSGATLGTRSGGAPFALGVIAGVYATIRQHARWLSSTLIGLRDERAWEIRFFLPREGYSEEGTRKNWFCLPGGLFRGETFRPLRRKGTRGGFVASPRVATRAATRVAPSAMTGLGRERLARGTYNEYGAWRAMCVSLRVRVWVCLCLRVFVRVLTFLTEILEGLTTYL